MNPALKRTNDQERLLPSTFPPSEGQEQFAAAVVLLLSLLLLAVSPIAHLPLAGTEHFLPVYAAGLLMNEIVTASLLFGLFTLQQTRAVLLLACGYLFSGLLVIPWALTFPGVFTESGLLDAGLQGTAWIAALRRVGFPLALLGYVLLRKNDDAGWLTSDEGRSSKLLFGSVFGIVLFCLGAAGFIVMLSDALPEFMNDERYASATWQAVPLLALGIILTAMALLWRRRRSVLDLWLLVVLFTGVVEICLLAFLSMGGRFTLGWWAGRGFGFLSSGIVLLVLLFEMTTLYARLARSVAAEGRAREARLATMEALTAAIAHEVNQPVASMVTNADAALRWLDRPSPERDETREALKRIVGDGHRAGEIIQSIRQLFISGQSRRTALDMNEQLELSLRRMRPDIRGYAIEVTLDLADNLPPILGDQRQLQQVITNICDNAIEALAEVDDRPRHLRIESRREGSGQILLRFLDNGIGLQGAEESRLFDPFYTTKADGMGMGLMLSKWVVENHGGRIVVAAGEAGGCSVSVTLPA